MLVHQQPFMQSADIQDVKSSHTGKQGHNKQVDANSSSL